MPENSSEIKKIVAKLVGVLNPRNKDILIRRFGVKTGSKETLESIGQDNGITRERVRQIQDVSLATIRNDNSFKSLAAPYVRLARTMIDECGGVMRESDLFSAFSGSSKSNPTNAALTLIMTLDGSTKRHPEDDNHHAYWRTSKEAAQQFETTIASLVSAFRQRKEVIAQDAVAQFAQSNTSLANIDTDTLNAYFSISKKVGKNVFAEVGLTSWPEIHPRGVRDKAYLVLKRAGKPQHFRDIARLINQSNFSNKKAHVQTAHNELIKDKRFTLVGRGMYALAQWGYKKGTVKDVIADLVRTKGSVHKDDIVAHVLSVRMVKPNTVLLGIQDRKLFKEDKNGKISLNVQEA